MDPVWTLFSRRTFSRLAYWLSALGYDLRDRSLGNRIYLVYFCLFWLAWIIAVVALLGGGISSAFGAIQVYSPPVNFVIVLVEYAFILWVLVVFWQVSRRSPFVFSQEDAYLLCQSPVSRRKTGLAWFVQGIMGSFILFAAAAVLLSFALVGWQTQGEITFFTVIEYLKAIACALIVIMPIQVGFQAGLWGLGALRLHQRREMRWMHLVFFVMVVFIVASFVFPALQPILVAPFRLAIEAAFMNGIAASKLLVGLGISFLYMIIGLAFLFSQTKNINLSRAAQETSHLTTTSQARAYGQFGLANLISQRRRLGVARSPSRLLNHSGSNILVWKDVLQFFRSFRSEEVFNFIWIFGLSLGMFSSSNKALQLLLAAVWTIIMGNLTTRRLRSDLARWWLFRSLPIRPREILKDEIILSCGVFTMLGWLALLFSHLTILSSLFLALLLPFLAINATLAAAHDILRHSKARTLMSPSLTEENVPRQNIGGVLQGWVSVLIPFGVAVLLSAYPELMGWSVAAVPLVLLITIFNRSVVLSAFHWIE